jgi:hypothetical protein
MMNTYRPFRTKILHENCILFQFVHEKLRQKFVFQFNSFFLSPKTSQNNDWRRKMESRASEQLADCHNPGKKIEKGPTTRQADAIFSLE